MMILNITYIDRELVLEPGQVELKILLLHEFGSPASHLGNDTSSHVDDESVRAVQQVQELAADGLVFSDRVLSEYLHSASVFLKFSM